MKLKVNWIELGKAIWAALKPVLLGAVGGGLVSITSGCSALVPAQKTQSMGVYALGIPGIAVITQTTQLAEYAGGDTNGIAQTSSTSLQLPSGNLKD